MKRFLSLTLALLLLTTLSLRAGSDRVIQTKQLPKAAQLFLAKHFAGRTVSLAKEDREEELGGLRQLLGLDDTVATCTQTEGREYEESERQGQKSLHNLNYLV